MDESCHWGPKMSMEPDFKANPVGSIPVSNDAFSSDQPRAELQPSSLLLSSQGPNQDFLGREGQQLPACWKPPSGLWH